MESGTQVQLQTEGPEIIITSSGSNSSSSNAKQQQTPSQKIIRTNIPRVVIVASGQSQSQLSNNNSSNTVDRKPATIGHHAGGQTLQQPVPPRPIIIHPPKMSVVASSSSNHHQGQGQHQNVSSSNGSDRQQVMIIQQQPTNVSNSNNHQQSTNNNNQSIIVTVADSDGRQETQTIYPLQYVSSNDLPGEMLYSTATTAGNQQDVHRLQSSATYVYQQEDGTAYSSQVNYYPNTSVSYQQSALNSPSSATGYIIQHNNQTVGVHEEETSTQLSHTTRASPATIQWLLQNYETAEGVSLPRCTLYNHYLKHCSENKLDPVNAASFGKLIRSVFLGLRTRRLGTRGNSKYHYYGIRIKPESPLNKMTEDTVAMAMRQQPTNVTPKRVIRPAAPNGSSHSQGHVPVNHSSSQPSSTGSNAGGTVCVGSLSPSEDHKHLLGGGAVPNVVPPSLSPMEQDFQRIGLTLEQAEKFFVGYRQHCEDLLDCVKNLLFNEVEGCWRQFWQADENNPLDDEDDEESSDMNLTGMTRTQLYSICTLQTVQEFIQTMDFQFYQVVVDVLVPNVLKPIPSNLTQSIRNFAKHLESGLAVALQGAPDVIVKLKLDAVTSLAQTLRRYTSLNHLAQAARAVLQNPTQISQMLTDLNRVDFRNVQEQASWVCYCNMSHVEEIEKSFKATLEKQNTLEQWADWLNSVVDQVLSEFCARPLNEFIASAKEFLLKWSFYSSMVMRDLTLRSAPSFGSFHLIRLLYDEYMFYLIEQRVARVTGQTTISVMSQSYRHHVHIGDMGTFSASHYNHPNNLSEQNGGAYGSYQMVDDSELSSGIGLLATSHAATPMSVQVVIGQNNPAVVVTDEGYLNGHSDSADEFFMPDDHHNLQEEQHVDASITANESNDISSPHTPPLPGQTTKDTSPPSSPTGNNADPDVDGARKRNADSPDDNILTTSIHDSSPNNKDQVKKIKLS